MKSKLEFKFKDMDYIVGIKNTFFGDNIEAKCYICKETINFRPYVDISNKKKLRCLKCINKELK